MDTSTKNPNHTKKHTKDIHLYSAQVCPFAQRTRLALIEKDLDFELTNIDLEDTPAWYREISPYGKVPLLKRGSDTLWESTIINEYIEEVYPTPSLLPSEPGQRALARIWIDYANTQFLPLFYKLLLEQDGGKQQELADGLSDGLDYMEREGPARTAPGPYWLGERLSLVDLAFYPFFERFPVLEHYRGYAVPTLCENLLQWLQTMQARPSVEATCNDAEYYIEAYARYANGSADGSTAQEMREA